MRPIKRRANHTALAAKGILLFSISVYGQTNRLPNIDQKATSSPSAASGTSHTAPAPTASQPPEVTKLLADAKALFRKGDFEGAIEKYQEVLQESPHSPDAYVGLTRVYLKKKDVSQAYSEINMGLQEADSPLVHVALGEVYFRQGKIPEAERQWVNVINSGISNARAYLGLARVRSAVSLHKSASVVTSKPAICGQVKTGH